MTVYRRAIWAVIASAMLLGSTACGSGFVDGPPLASVRLVVPHCTGGEFPPVTRVPKGFEPTTALVCGAKFDGSPRDDLVGGRTTLTKPFTVTTYQGDFTAALREFSRKDKRKTGECNSSIRLPELWLIDARGLGLRPRYPADNCGGSNISGLNEVLKLPVLQHHTIN